MVDARLLRVGELLATSLVNTLGCHFAKVVLSRDTKKEDIFLGERRVGNRVSGCFKHRQSGLIGFSVGSSKVPSSRRGKHRSAYYSYYRALLSPVLFSPRFLVISTVEDVSHKSSLLSSCPCYPLHPRRMWVMRYGQTQRGPTQQAETIRLHRIGHYGPCQQSLERRL